MMVLSCQQGYQALILDLASFKDGHLWVYQVHS